jgi:hypothetical protein
LVADGVFEIALGLLLATIPLTGLEHQMRLPPPANTGVIVAAGLLLIPLGATLLALASIAPRRLVLALAAGNVVSAAVLAGWLVALWPHFAPAGAWVVGVTTVGLIVFGALEARGGSGATGRIAGWLGRSRRSALKLCRDARRVLMVVWA